MQLELRWPPGRAFGRWTGGIFGLFRRYAESAGAYFYASTDQIHIQVFSAIRERLGEVEIPTNYANVIAMRDALNLIVKILDEAAESAALNIIHEHPGVGAGQLDRFLDDQDSQVRVPRLGLDALEAACERLNNAGLVESRYEKVSLDDGKPFISYYLTDAGIARRGRLG